MKNEQFTPGPWEVSPDGLIDQFGGYRITPDTSGNMTAEPICFIKMDTYDRNTVTHKKIKKANANLIAAAPDMYEALKDLYLAYQQNDYGIIGLAEANAKAALSKANRRII